MNCPPEIDPVRSAKRKLRAAMTAVRKQLSVDSRTEDSRRIEERLLELPEFAGAETFFVYVSCRSEVQTHGLIRCLWRQGKVVTVPKVPRSGLMEAHRIDDWSQLEPGPFDILAPVGTRPCVESIDVCVTPGLAFTQRGDRLGSGRGHYDRFLSERPTILAIGLAFDCQIIEQIPSDAWDRAMRLIVAPARVIRV
jgi:5-formyltetrahydrofolate cyclo-ligase